MQFATHMMKHVAVVLGFSSVVACTSSDANTDPVQIVGRWAMADSSQSGACVTGVLQDWVQVAAYDNTSSPVLVAAQTFTCERGGFTLPIALDDLSWQPTSLNVEVTLRSGDQETLGQPVDFNVSSPVSGTHDIGLVAFP
jgi:hypothetical protein